jgi:hypothetical protein
MAAEDADFVVHLGDYIYEKSWGRDLVRRHEGGLATTLEEYRDRYAQYKSDRDLQASHAAFPWIVTWDDHEVADDYAGDVSPVQRIKRFLAQRPSLSSLLGHMPAAVDAAAGFVVALRSLQVWSTRGDPCSGRSTVSRPSRLLEHSARQQGDARL